MASKISKNGVDLLKATLKANNLSFRAASLKAGLGPDTLSKIFKNKIAKEESLQKLSDEYGVPLSMLTGNPEPDAEPLAYAPMPDSMRGDEPLEFNQEAFDKTMVAVSFWKKMRGGQASIMEITKLMWVLYEHELKISAEQKQNTESG